MAARFVATALQRRVNDCIVKSSDYQYSSSSFSHNPHNLLNGLLQLFSLEKVQYKLKGNWMVIVSQVGTSNHVTGGMCDPLLKLNYIQLCNNSYNGIKLALIGSSDSDVLPEQVELVSALAKCINAILNQIATVILLNRWNW